MARPPGSHGSETRERILDAAQQLFTQQGYDKTSLRDIAERLEITKAALYYYFARKEEILIALHDRLGGIGASIMDELEAAPDSATRTALWPRLTDQLIDFMVDNRDLILLHLRNQSAFEALDIRRHDADDTEARFGRLIASTEMPLRERVRMAAMIGIITEVFGANAAAFEDAPVTEVAELVREAIRALDATMVSGER